jgi:hypothetical protein
MLRASSIVTASRHSRHAPALRVERQRPRKQLCRLRVLLPSSDEVDLQIFLRTRLRALASKLLQLHKGAIATRRRDRVRLLRRCRSKGEKRHGVRIRVSNSKMKRVVRAVPDVAVTPCSCASSRPHAGLLHVKGGDMTIKRFESLAVDLVRLVGFTWFRKLLHKE